MTEPDSTQWYLDRIEKTKLMIVAYEDGISALSSGAQNYRLNTGQTDQMVTRANLASMRIALVDLESRLERLSALVYGGQTCIRPGF